MGWAGIVHENGRLFCAPFNAEEVLVIDPEATGEDARISFIHLGHRPQQRDKWSSITAWDGRLYCAPSCADEVLVINPYATTEQGCIVFIPISARGPWKYGDIACLQGRLYCVPLCAADVLVITPAITPATKIEDSSVEVIPTGDFQDFKWGGMAESHGLLFCIPRKSTRVLVIGPKGIQMMETGLSELDKKWLGCTVDEQSGVVYAAPRNADSVLSIDPALIQTRAHVLKQVGISTPERAAPEGIEVVHAN